MSPSEAPELVEITRVVEDTLNLVQWEAEQLSVSVCTELQPGLRVMASDSEMRMVMLNLIQNAFHAMPDGGQLEVSSNSDNNKVTVIVKDTGIGIDPDKLAFIFDPFYSRRADGAKGTGLGLSIVRTIVENYSGSIAVESQPGSGSRLTVCLPDANTADGFTA
jgi:signal transduction histidine kinase